MTAIAYHRQLDAWCSHPHEHSRCCWWNWETARWVCPATDPATPSTDPTDPEFRQDQS